tara:strand:- start:1899 stop:2060 length:162 start_codon:yes stop_codon:yes gene_type:complete
MIVAVPVYDEWGHAVSKLEKPKLAKALEETSENLKPSEPKAEILVIEEPEDII